MGAEAMDCSLHDTSPSVYLIKIMPSMETELDKKT